MSGENPNERGGLTFNARFEALEERSAALKNRVESRGLSFSLIGNVLANLLQPISMSLGISEMGGVIDSAMLNENFSLAERYIQILEENEAVLVQETSMDEEARAKISQKEIDHAREIIEKYG